MMWHGVSRSVGNMVDLIQQAVCLASPVIFWKHFTLCCPRVYSVQVWLVYSVLWQVQCKWVQYQLAKSGLSTFLRRAIHCEHIGHFGMCPTWRGPLPRTDKALACSAKRARCYGSGGNPGLSWHRCFSLSFNMFNDAP